MLRSPRSRLALLLLLASLGMACGDDGSSMDGGAPPGDTGVTDGATPNGAGGDTGASPDASTPDASGDATVDAPAADTWTTFAQTFFADYCVGCHASGPRDYRTMADVLRDSSEIACGVNPDARARCAGFPPPGQFPVGTGPKPSDAERRRLVAWIDAGLPE